MNKKKKVIISIVMAAILVMAMSVTALAAEPVISVDNPKPQVGDQITFTIKTSDVSVVAEVQASDNLHFEGSTGAMAANENKFASVNSATVTYTYTVTGEAGEAYSFALANVVCSDGSSDVEETVAPVTGTVEAAPAPSGDPSEPTQQPSEDPSEPTQQPSEPTGEPSAQPSDSQNADELDDVPKTGDATTDLWVLAAVGIAAAAAVAVVAGKKVFSHK
ncbi:hypothetical protein [Christensenella massiliensis]|uniref:LPXTG cell wall anchor domain-containing protein n=1 Tax=Christensenella massiliensis TaxID=1805714 RepID=A0AAU8A625_9FIRM